MGDIITFSTIGFPRNISRKSNFNVFINMKFIITENKIKDLITKVVGYDLSDRIEIITNWFELTNGGHFTFRRDREKFNKDLNHYGPFFMISVGPGRYHNRYYVQYQGKENGWLIRGESVTNSKLDESDFLNILGIESLGIGLNYIINNFVDE